MGLRQALEFMVARRLAGNDIELQILRLALVEHLSPSEIAHRLNVRKSLVRSTVYMFKKSAGDPYAAEEIVRKFLPVIMKIKPVIRTYYWKEYRCEVCGASSTVIFDIHKARLTHIRKSHMDLVYKYVNDVLREVGSYVS
jgi:hypothetical protein